MLTFIQKVQLQKGKGIVLVYGSMPDHKKIYAFIRMTREQIDQLQRDIQQGGCVDLHTYGDVLESGWGEPDDNTRQRMAKYPA